MRGAATALVIALAATAVGCVERRFTVVTDPPGAAILVNNRPVGSSPVDVPFLYYGTYEITAIADGYQTLNVKEPIKPPLYERVPFDFFAENVWPFHIEDARRLEYRLQPRVQPNAGQLLDEAEQLRSRGRTLPYEAQNVGKVSAAAQGRAVAQAPEERR